MATSTLQPVLAQLARAGDDLKAQRAHIEAADEQLHDTQAALADATAAKAKAEAAFEAANLRMLGAEAQVESMLAENEGCKHEAEVSIAACVD